MKTNLIAFAFAAATLTSFAAFADHEDDYDCDDDSNAYHPASAAGPAADSNGHYELRDTQKWIPARYEQVVVQQCVERSHGHNNHWKERCYPVSQTRVVPAHYETVQEWVYVPTPRYQQYSQYPSQRPPMYSQGRVGFSVNIR